MSTSGGDEASALKKINETFRKETIENETGENEATLKKYRRGTRELRERAIEDERPAYIHGNQLLSVVMREQMSWMKAAKTKSSAPAKVDAIGEHSPHRLNKKSNRMVEISVHKMCDKR